MALTVGEFRSLTGNVTTLNWIGARSPQMIEQSVGYGAGRLAQGYWIALLKDMLLPADFELGGTTLRSGGRLGLPAATTVADQARPRVHDEVLSESGEAGYRQLQMFALQAVRLQGPGRVAKVLPMTPHDPNMTADLQYPPGGGGPQWTLLPPGKRFLIAARVEPNGQATTTTFSVDIRQTMPYENRAKFMRYLESA